MAQAARSINVPFTSFARYAKEWNIYQPNQGGKGIKTPISQIALVQIPLNEILIGLHPNYKSHSLRLKILKAKLKKHECENCKLSKWLDNDIPLELHHIDGNSKNHRFSNLQLLCPNCHTLTDNYKSKNIKKKAPMVE